eukprot:Gb_00606 [translate_table: standard]
MGSGDEEFRRTNLGSRAEWHPDTVARLIDGYGEKCANVKGYLKTRDWEEIVKYVNIQCEGSKTPKTMQRCREKIDSLKRRYKLEKKRAELRGSSHVNWSFFEKLDQIMRNLKRSGNVSEGQSFELAGAVDCPVSGPDGFEGDDRPQLMIAKGADKGKACIENADVLLVDGLNAEGNRCSNRRVRIDIQDKGIKGKKALGVSDRISKRNICKVGNPNSNPSPNRNPVQALADALVGFSEVYSRIEIAKMELFTKMNIELAKLQRKKKKSGSSSSLDCAESEKYGTSE